MGNRILKESICTSDTIDKLSWFDEVLFYRLLVNCDDYGRFDGRTAIIKSRLFPLKSNITDKSLVESINRLSTVGLVMPYVCDGKPYLQLVTWDRHQRVRAKRGKYPEPDGACCHMSAHDSECRPNPIQSESNPNPNPNTNLETGAQGPCPTPAGEKPKKHKYGEYGWVQLTEEEYTRLLADLGEKELSRCIAYVDESAQSTGNKNKWRDWNLVIRKCARGGWGKGGSGKAVVSPQAPPSYDLSEFERMMQQHTPKV